MVDESQKNAQEKVLMYQILQNQLEELNRQAGLVETRMAEIETAESALNEMKKSGEGSEMLVPMGAGCYGHGKVLKKDKYMVEIGAGLVASKNLPEALRIMNDRRKDVKDASNKIRVQMEQIAASMNRIGAELQEMQNKEAASRDRQPKDGGNDIFVG